MTKTKYLTLYRKTPEKFDEGMETILNSPWEPHGPPYFANGFYTQHFIAKGDK